MRLLDFPHTAYKVAVSSHVLFTGASASSISLTGTKPTVSFRCQVRLYSATDHTDCVGSVVVNAETLTFTQASKKVTSTLLTALPTVTSSNLDCMVEIIAIDAAGNIIIDESNTAIKIRFEPTTRAYINKEGQWIQSSAYCMVVDPTILPDSTIIYNGVRYIINEVEALPWLDGTELYRILYFA